MVAAATPQADAVTFCVCGFPTRDPGGFCRSCRRRMAEVAASGPGSWIAPADPGGCPVRTTFEGRWWCVECQARHGPGRRARANPRHDLAQLERRAAQGDLGAKRRVVEALEAQGRAEEWVRWMTLDERLSVLEERMKAALAPLVGVTFYAQYVQGLMPYDEEAASDDLIVSLGFSSPVEFFALGVETDQDDVFEGVSGYVVIEPIDRGLARALVSDEQSVRPGVMRFFDRAFSCRVFVATASASGVWKTPQREIWSSAGLLPPWERPAP